MYSKDSCETKYQLLFNKREVGGLKHCNDSEVFTKHSNGVDNIYENVEQCNLNTGCKMLIVFDDVIVDMLSNKNSVQ